MPNAPTPEERDIIARAAVLAVALLVYPRVMDPAGGAYALTRSEEDAEAKLRPVAALAFAAARAFVAQATDEGMDPATIMELAAKAGAL